MLSQIQAKRKAWKMHEPLKKTEWSGTSAFSAVSICHRLH